ncbi:MAG: hypothetical protein KME07_24835 [Pegethrix bostrychoides GSE-TBD4-15B]|jgi:hypothetical protein|uniref:Uncharacterized protein n=1 Tax=Pegethrix bostrychoides GSE-TBD4-15B TaxID=2839662 RepID=A0A951PFH0_9CYAN|nr:hypothetical protein [Pegethrix bostrychoides GSE-TBD4-15B]
MIMLSAEDIARYRAQLADNAVALQALDMIEDCEGNLEDAAINLALQVGQEPDHSDFWLDGLAKRWRVFLCQTGLKETLQAGSVVSAVNLLAAETSIPAILATPVVLYVTQSGTENFCKPLQEKI